jgi:HPr kinase/phosphorylase
VTDTLLQHATAVAIDGEAVLLRGPPGSGKSDLALRLIDDGAQLIADDQTLLRRDGDRIFASAPPAIAGLIEVRGVGLVGVPAAVAAPLILIAELVVAGDIERMPEPQFEMILGLTLPLVALAPFEASAPAKLRLLRRALAASPLPVIMRV